MRKYHEILSPLSCWNKATDDEFVFVLLARDKAAPVAIRAWANERLRLGKNKANDLEIIEALQIASFIESSNAEPSPLAKELNLDVQAEEARALHRVVRAMHDGYCPKCGCLEQAGKFYTPPTEMEDGYHRCPICNFTIDDFEAKTALATFTSTLQKSVALFESWRERRKQEFEELVKNNVKR